MPRLRLSGTITLLVARAVRGLIACGLLILLGCGQSPKSGETGGPTDASQVEAYKSKIELSHIGLAKGENYLGNQVFYVEGTVKNNGEKVVQRIELTFLFKDSLNQVVLKEARRAVDYRTSRGLESQKSTTFQVAFDHLPRDWNYVLPEVQVTNIVFK